MVFLQSNNDMIIFGPPILSAGYWLERCKNTALYVHVRSTCVSKAIFREKSPSPPTVTGRQLFLLEVWRKSERKSIGSKGETEFSIQQDWRAKGVRTAGCMCHDWAVSKRDKGADRGWTYAQSRWTSARQIGQVRLACKEPIWRNQISLMLLFLVRF